MLTLTARVAACRFRSANPWWSVQATSVYRPDRDATPRVRGLPKAHMKDMQEHEGHEGSRVGSDTQVTRVLLALTREPHQPMRPKAAAASPPGDARRDAHLPTNAASAPSAARHCARRSSTIAWLPSFLLTTTIDDLSPAFGRRYTSTIVLSQA